MLADRLEEAFRQSCKTSDESSLFESRKISWVLIETTEKDIRELADFLIQNKSKSWFHERYRSLRVIILIWEETANHYSYPTKEFVLSCLRRLRQKAGPQIVQ